MLAQPQVAARRYAVRRPASRSLPLPTSSYWPWSVPLAIAVIAIVGARAHDGVPLIRLVRPALLIGYGGGLLALLSSSGTVVRRAMSHPIFKTVALYVAWMAVTVPFAVWQGGAFGTLRGNIPLLTITLTCLLCPPTRRTIEQIQRGFVLACATTGIVALRFGYIDGEGRLSTYASLDSNDLAAVMAMALPLTWGLLARDRVLWRKVVWALCGVLQVYVLMKAGSRGGFIALVTATLLYIAGQRGTRRVTFAVIALAGGIAAWNVGTQQFRDKVVSLVHGEEDYNYTDWTGRKQVWARARGYIAERPIIGVGVGNFQFREGETCRAVAPLGTGCKWSAAHNTWLQAGAELGIPGLLIFIWLLLRSARIAVRTWSARHSPPGLHRPELFAALVGFATAATFLSHAYFYLLFGLIGLIALTGLTAEQERARASLVAHDARQRGPAAPRQATPLWLRRRTR